MSTTFLETSALLRMLFGEEGGDETRRKILASRRVLGSRLLQVESERALIRVGLDHPELERRLPELRRELRDFWPVVHFLELTRDVCDLAGRIAPSSRLRTLDALHLATFYKLREIDPSTEILSFDHRILAEV